MFNKCCSAVLNGLRADLISVEVDISKGVPAFHIVGLASRSVSESKERVTAAMQSSDFEAAPSKILVNLSPAHIKKEGVQLDLAIAAALMLTLDYIDIEAEFFSQFCFLAELSLSGETKAIQGMLPMALLAQSRGVKHLVIARENSDEAALVLQEQSGMKIHQIANLAELKILLELLQEEKNGDSAKAAEALEAYRVVYRPIKKVAPAAKVEISEIIGQSQAKRALEIAAAGKHHVLMVGPPGCGKSMLAKSFAGLIPEMTFNEILECSKIYSISGALQSEIKSTRPFRAPHHSATVRSLIGGGVPIQPGEVSLAHNGVLFLDELTEFKRYVIEQLRQILEEKEVQLNKANHCSHYPADFTLVAACNPCPCGYLGDSQKACTDSHTQIQKYISKLSGPLLDRIDIHLELSRLTEDEFALLSDVDRKKDGDKNETIKMNIEESWDFKNYLLKHQKDKKELFRLDQDSREFLTTAAQSLNLSARSHAKIMNIGRTIANLAQSEKILLEHLAEALQYRSLSWEKYIQ